MKIKIIFCLLSIWILSSCNPRLPKDEKTGKPMSVGSYDRILVLMDNAEWNEYGEEITRILSKPVYLSPGQYNYETVYDIIRGDNYQLKNYLVRKNMFWFCTLDSDGPVSQRVRDIVDDGTLARAEQQGGQLFIQRDAWAADQLMFILIARNADLLMKAFHQYYPKIDEIMEEAYRQRTLAGLYNYGEQTEFARHFQYQYGWHLRIPRGYVKMNEVVTPETAEHQRGFTWFRKRVPGLDRILFVYWEEADSTTLTPDYCFNKRDELTGTYYEGDKLDREISTVDTVTFLGKRGYKIEGFWVNEQYVIGGPMRSYTFYSPEDRRIYMIDLCLYAPGEDKYLAMTRLDLIAHTFSTQPIP
ncbi:MAG: DUF4837 family protein [Gemmatimonadetes bacterium]|nr:MAG: DUF4837 family protein [Gemmatimonadota bacterium]